MYIPICMSFFIKWQSKTNLYVVNSMKHEYKEWLSDTMDTGFEKSFFDHFLVIFSSCKRFLCPKTKGEVLWPNGHRFREVIFWSFFGHFTTCNCFFALKTIGEVLWPNGHRFGEVIFWSFFGHFTTCNWFLGSKNGRGGPMT